MHSGYLYSASSSPLLLSVAPDTARILCRNFKPKRLRQLWVKDLHKVPTWRLEWELNPWPFGRKALTLPKRHHAPLTSHRASTICSKIELFFKYALPKTKNDKHNMQGPYVLDYTRSFIYRLTMPILAMFRYNLITLWFNHIDEYQVRIKQLSRPYKKTDDYYSLMAVSRNYIRRSESENR